MTNTKEHSQEEHRRIIHVEPGVSAPKDVPSQNDIQHRHYAPIQAALPAEASSYEWKRETVDIQSYRHNHNGSWLHIDAHGNFYYRHAHPIGIEAALQNSGSSVDTRRADIAQTQSITSGSTTSEHSISL